MSKENAEQLLNSVMQDEKDVQDKVKKQQKVMQGGRLGSGSYGRCNQMAADKTYHNAMHQTRSDHDADPGCRKNLLF